MDLDEALELIEQILLSRQLSSTERFVLRQSWHGRTYDEMARDCGYGSVYIKEIGSQLWHSLSQSLGERVTKKICIWSSAIISRTDRVEHPFDRSRTLQARRLRLIAQVFLPQQKLTFRVVQCH